jgi:hypothetical protein
MHQFQLFGFKEMRPIKKVPISEARIREAQSILEERNGKLKKSLTASEGRRAEVLLRDVREGLENYLNRLR